ncbi:hypothetical protein [Paraburkholderia sp. SIMBA_054]|jgi:hypothetical protein|uniref:hypothetical protein n=1 Tax=Paraburkholderia TaxID=1822464 RepID=UPI00397D40AD
MARRILFVPFIKAPIVGGRPGRAYVNKNLGWINSYNAKEVKKKAVLEGAVAHDIHECWYIPRTPNSMIASLGPDDQLYIRGHSLIGLEGIFDEATKDEQGKPIHQSKMDQELLVKLNEGNDTGTKKLAFMLKASDVVTRLFESGLRQDFSGTIKCYNCHSAEGEQNFAKALEKALTERGYKKCRIYGYTGALSSMYDGEHKTSTDPNGRARDARVEIKRT